jgi:cyclopropane fatty-acyl-phospholipid synthase-like methyltransferase
MDAMDYWAIADQDIEIQNALTDRKLRLLDGYCAIRDGLEVLDIGCGKAWLMRQWAERHDIRGTGLELNPHFVKFARDRSAAKGLNAKLNFIEGKALDLNPEPASYDIALCLGTSFTLGGFVQALDWMSAVVRPGGTMVIGDLVLKHRPVVPVDEQLPGDALEAIAVIERHGAEVSATISASDADFERFVSHHRHSTLAWGREHPNHPDHADVLARSRKEWTHYLKIVRPYLGWTVFAGRRRG